MSGYAPGGGGGGGAPAYHSGPLQLVRIDDDGRCHLQDAALSILNQITGKLAVVGVAGLYRTGKSFLLNRLLGLQEGFDIGPTVNPCTKGLWMWGAASTARTGLPLHPRRYRRPWQHAAHGVVRHADLLALCAFLVLLHLQFYGRNR